MKYDFFFLSLSGYILFTACIRTNGFISLFSDNSLGFHLGAYSSIVLEIAAIIRTFFRRSLPSIYIRVLVLLFSLFLIGVILVWITISNGI